MLGTAAGPGVNDSRARVILLGAMGESQSATVVWQVLHYLEGLRRLGHEVFYVEDTGRPLADPTPACELIDRTMARLGLGGQWLLRNAHDGEVHGFLARDFPAPFL